MNRTRNSADSFVRDWVNWEQYLREEKQGTEVTFENFIIELKNPGIGAPAIAGAICLVLGGLTLFDRSVPNATVSPWVIGAMAVLVTAFFGFVIQAAIKMRRVPVTSEADLRGAEAVVVRTLDPSGTVRIESEEWSAIADARIEEGATVRVTAVNGLQLKVEPSSEQGPPEALSARQEEGN